jgi:hypothetical protein
MVVTRHVDFPIHQNATVTTSGNSATFSPPTEPDHQEHRSSILVSVGGVSGTSPQVIFKVQASLDGINWFDCMGAQTLTAAGTARIEFSAVEPFHQVVWTVSGTTPSFSGVNSHLIYLK